jgi:stage V sporulation protein K
MLSFSRHSEPEPIQIETLIGLQTVKDTLRQIAQRLRLENLRAAANPDYQAGIFSGHFVFYGNPGTGKTTVAHLLGRLLKELGVLPTDRVVKAERAQLVAGYVGQTAIKTEALINQAMGGILFIDEAYTLARGSENDFGPEAIETLLTRMENDRGRFVVVVAGYRQPMQDFLNANEGLRSRFNLFLDFEDYNPTELYEILCYMLQQGQNHFSDEPELEPALRNHFERMYAERNAKFANARDVRNFYEQICTAQAARLADLVPPASGEQLFTVTWADVSRAIGGTGVG